MAKLTKQQVAKKEKIVKAMKRNKDDFDQRYGPDAKSVMYATATSLAKKNVVEFAVKFDESISAYEFADRLRGYNISKNDAFSTERDGSTTVMFESKIDNDDFINWLCEKHDGVGVTLTYEDFLPIPSNTITGANAMTFDKFASSARAVDYDVFFSEETISEADDAYKKTQAYRKMKGDKKEAVDYFMQQIEKRGLEKIEKVVKDTTVRYTISANELNKFLETIFFAEDVDYIYSLTEADPEDPMKKKVEKDREEGKKEQKKESDEKAKEKKDDQKDAEKKREDASKESEKNSGEDKEENEKGPAPNTKTFNNFKSELKPGEKGKPSIVNTQGGEKMMKLEKPAKGSPVEDAELDEE